MSQIDLTVKGPNIARPLIDVYDLSLKDHKDEGLFGSFYIVKSKKNEEAYNLCAGKNKVEIDNEPYVIQSTDQEDLGDTVEKFVSFKHEMFDRLRKFQNGTLTGNRRLEQCLDLALAGTGLTYTLIGSFPSEQFEEFGKARAQELFNTAKSRFGFEFKVTGTHLIIAREIARITDTKFIHGHNLVTISEKIDVSEVATYVEGYGAIDEETGNYIVTCAFESELSGNYRDENGNKKLYDAEFVHDLRFSVQSQLDEEAKSRLQPHPLYSVEVEVVELFRNGWKLYDYQSGDYTWAKHEGFDMDVQIRINSVERFPLDPDKSPIIQLGDIRQDITKKMALLSKTEKRLTLAEGGVTSARREAQSAADLAKNVQKEFEANGGTFTAHMNNSSIHITEADRLIWNSKADPGDSASFLLEAKTYTDDQLQLLDNELRRLLLERLEQLQNQIDPLLEQNRLLKQQVDDLESRLSRLEASE